MLKETDKRVVRSFVNEKPASSNLLETDGVRLDKIGLGGETVAKWIDGRIAIVSTESVKSDESIIRLIKSTAGPGVVDFSYARKGHRVHEHGAMGRNGRGIYYETGVMKHDLVIYQDHRERWRLDLITGALGTHANVTGPNAGYGSAEAAFQAALDVQRVRNIRGKSHVWIKDRDGNLSDYEPMEANGRAPSAARVRQDMEASFYYNERKIADAKEELRRPGISAEYRQQLRDLIASAESDMEYARGRMEPNGRATVVDDHAARELDLYIANNYALVGAPNSKGKSIDATLKRKLTKGHYSSALAPQLWQYLVDEGASRYLLEFPGSPRFNAETRRSVARDFARAWEEENGIVEAERIR